MLFPNSIDLDGDGSPDLSLDQLDPNGDGHISAQEILSFLKGEGIEPGSAQAKAFWKGLEAQAKSPEARAFAEAQGHPDATGWYNGPLQKGPHPGDGDFEFLVHKLIVKDGIDPARARAIAGSVKVKLYG